MTRWTSFAPRSRRPILIRSSPPACGRARLECALALPREVLVSQTNTTTEVVTAQEPSYRHGDVGYAWLSVPDINRAVAFHTAVRPADEPQTWP